MVELVSSVAYLEGKKILTVFDALGLLFYFFIVCLCVVLVWSWGGCGGEGGLCVCVVQFFKILIQ